MSAPTLGLTKKPSLTQEREKLERDQVFAVIILVVYFAMTDFSLDSRIFSFLIHFIFVHPSVIFFIFNMLLF